MPDDSATQVSAPHESAATEVRVLIADDHPAIVEGLSTALQRYAIRTVATATKLADILGQVDAENPDVIILDVRFNESATGLNVAEQILKAHPAAKVVFYTQFDQDEMILEAYRLGAKAFVTKSTAATVVAAAIRAVQSGRTYFLPEIAERLALLRVKGDDSPRARLDEREYQVFVMMAQGLTNAEMADRLSLSTKTISTTSQSVKEKLGIARHADATLLAVKHGIISV